MSEIKAVIFDCDGVIIDSEVISAQMLQAEARALKLPIDLEHILTNYVGRSYPKVLADLQEQFKITLPEEFEENYRARLLAAFELDLRLIPGVDKVFEKLNVPFCVATSSSPKRVNRSLEIVGQKSVFGQHIYTSSQVENGKPAPDLFLFAAKNLGVEPKSCLVIEDSVSGIKAGLCAQMRTIRFTGGSHILNRKETAGADFSFDKFENFFNYFPNLEKKG